MADTFSFEDASTPVAKPSTKPQTFSFEDAGKPAAKAPAKASPEKSALGQFLDIHPGVGAAELGLNLGTGMLAAPVSGLAGLGAAAGNALGLTKASPADVVRKVGSAMTYDPRTTAGKGVTGAVTAPFEALGHGADIAGSYAAEKTGSPALGAAVNTAIQSAPALIGKVFKNPAAARLSKETAALEAEKKANAPRDAAVEAAREKGYVLPPSVAGAQGPLSSFFQGEVGSTKMDYGSSYKNQRVTNSLIKKELGLPTDEPLSVKALAEIRDKQGAAYEAVKKAVPDLQVTQEFKDAIRNPNSKFSKAKAEFPEYFKNKEVEGLVKTLSRDKFSAEAAIELQKKLRYDGYDNLKAFDNPSKKALGEAQINAAKQIDALIDQNLAMKAPPGVNNFQSKLASNLADARKKIAQTYAVEKALNDTTGNVSARSLAKMWEKEQTLTGGLKDVAQTAKAFEKQMRDVDKLPATASENISNMDVAKATGLAALGHGTIGAGLTLGRMGLKPLLLSDYYQNRYVKPGQYQPGMGYTSPAQALGNPIYPLATIPRPPYEQKEP